MSSIKSQPSIAVGSKLRVISKKIDYNHIKSKVEQTPKKRIVVKSNNYLWDSIGPRNESPKKKLMQILESHLNAKKKKPRVLSKRKIHLDDEFDSRNADLRNHLSEIVKT